MDQVRLDVHYSGETDGENLKNTTLDECYLVFLVHLLEIRDQFAESHNACDLAGELA